MSLLVSTLVARSSDIDIFTETDISFLQRFSLPTKLVFMDFNHSASFSLLQKFSVVTFLPFFLTLNFNRSTVYSEGETLIGLWFYFSKYGNPIISYNQNSIHNLWLFCPWCTVIITTFDETIPDIRNQDKFLYF